MIRDVRHHDRLIGHPSLELVHPRLQLSDGGGGIDRRRLALDRLSPPRRERHANIGDHRHGKQRSDDNLGTHRPPPSLLPGDQAIVVEVRPKEPRASPGGVRLCGRLWRGRWVRLNGLWNRIGRDDGRGRCVRLNGLGNRIGRDDGRRRGGRQDEQQCGDAGCRAHGRSVPLRGPVSTLSDETRSSGDETTFSADRGTSRQPSRPRTGGGRTAPAVPAWTVLTRSPRPTGEATATALAPPATALAPLPNPPSARP